MPGCCAYGCSNRSENNFKLYGIPSGDKNETRRKIWLTRITRENFEPSSNVRLCEVHFEKSEFEDKIPGKLKPSAIPSLFSHVPAEVHSAEVQDCTRSILPNEALRSSPRKVIKLDHAYHDSNRQQALNSGPTIADDGPDESFTDPDESFADPDELLEDPNESFADPVSVEVSSNLEGQPIPTEKENLQRLTRKVERLKKKCTKLKKQNNRLEKNYSTLLNPDQVKALSVRKNPCWSEKTVKKALQLRFTCGSNGYQMLLSQGYPLPADRTLRRKLQFVAFNNGISEDVFRMLSSKIQSMEEQEKKVALSLDEMAIQPSLDYDCRSGGILGLPTVLNSNGKESNELATHALVFMLHGVSTPWKQVVAYEFTCNSFSAQSVKDLILHVVHESHNIGLDVKSVTMDMGGGNQAVLREFGINCVRSGDVHNSFPHPVLENAQLHFFADTPHLLKNLRNHITRGQIIYLPENVVEKFNLPSNAVSVTYLKELVRYDEEHELKLAPHLKDRCLNPNHFEKMKVAPAQAVMSRKTAAALRILVEQKVISTEALTTAWFIEQVDMWYTLMTSRSSGLALSNFSLDKLKEAETFLSDFATLIQNINIGKLKAVWKPVQKGILLSTKSALDVKDVVLNDDNYLFLCMARFTQDGLENLFSTVRLKNPVPTALEFKNALRIICLTQLLNANKQGSYNVDPSVEIQVPVDTSFPSKPMEQMNSVSSENTHPCSYGLSLLEKMSLYNLSGYCVKKFLSLNKHCEECKLFLTTRERPQIADLCVEKCYVVDSLTFASAEVYEFLLVAENVIIEFSELILKTGSILPRLIHEVNRRSGHLTFPDCHNSKQLVLKRFLTTRMHSFLAEKRKKLKNEQKGKLASQAESSRSVAMRERIRQMR